MRIYREDDLRENLLKHSTVAILGYGNQGHAHALNLRDSGVGVIVGTRRGGTGWEEAARGGFESVSVATATERADVVVVMLPDETQGQVFKDEIAPALRPEATIIFPHGFTIAFGVIEPPEGHDVLLVAPKGQGHYLRKSFMESRGLPCLVGVARDSSGQALQKALSYASLVGCLSAGALETTFREEAVTDLFGEQVVLCGGVPELIKSAFDELVERGYAPEVAYLECLHELKIIADLMYEGGIHYMRERISKTAAWGSFETGPRVVDKSVRRHISEVLDDIESGRFAREWMKESKGDANRLSKRMREEMRHPSEAVGRRIRALMPFLSGDKAS
jgi:ketol-acid reductoisomerase